LTDKFGLTPGEFLLRILYYPVVTVATRVLLDLRLEGAQAVPRSGPAIIVPNHQGYLDPFLIQLATPRPARFMVTADFYDIRVIQPFFRIVKAIRVDEGGRNRESLKTALKVLRQGEVVGIFPEGQLTRDGRIGTLHPGVAFLAAKSGAPVAPVRIRGSYDVFPRGGGFPRRARVSIHFGGPITVTDRRKGIEQILEVWRKL
jgi:1-acyl-sn-glycerol-3-phosphate acyltransferase